jgi:hypothetical protein
MSSLRDEEFSTICPKFTKKLLNDFEKKFDPQFFFSSHILRPKITLCEVGKNDAGKKVGSAYAPQQELSTFLENSRAWACSKYSPIPAVQLLQQTILQRAI